MSVLVLAYRLEHNGRQRRPPVALHLMLLVALFLHFPTLMVYTNFSREQMREAVVRRGTRGVAQQDVHSSIFTAASLLQRL